MRHSQGIGKRERLERASARSKLKWSSRARRTAAGLEIEDTTWLGLLQQALDGAAKEDLPEDVAELVTKLQERLVAIQG